MTYTLLIIWLTASGEMQQLRVPDLPSEAHCITAGRIEVAVMKRVLRYNAKPQFFCIGGAWL